MFSLICISHDLYFLVFKFETYLIHRQFPKFLPELLFSDPNSKLKENNETQFCFTRKLSDTKQE